MPVKSHQVLGKAKVGDIRINQVIQYIETEELLRQKWKEIKDLQEYSHLKPLDLEAAIGLKKLQVSYQSLVKEQIDLAIAIKKALPEDAWVAIQSGDKVYKIKHFVDEDKKWKITYESI